MDKQFNFVIQNRYDTYSNWQKSSRILAQGEIGFAKFENDTEIEDGVVISADSTLFKVGDGKNSFNNLPWACVPTQGGASSIAWENIENKPFGEIAHWKRSVTWGDSPNSFKNAKVDEWVKVSDVVVTEEDLKRLAPFMWIFYCMGEEHICESFNYTLFEDDGYIEGYGIDYNSGNLVNLVRFYPNGIYFTKTEYYTVEGLCYPTAIFFPENMFSTIKVLNQKDLPKGVLFGETYGSTWRYSNNFFGEVTDVTDEGFYKISDSAVNLEDLSAGYTTIWHNLDGTLTEEYFTADNAYVQDDGSIILLGSDSFSSFFDAVVCYPENSSYPPGVYVLYIGANDYLESLTIYGFQGLPQTTIIDSKYLPEGFGGSVDIDAISEQVAERFEQSLLEAVW